MMKKTNLFYWLVLLICVGGTSSIVVAVNLHVKQVLVDGENGVDGLDNPRHIALSSNNRYTFVTSADDNALLILKVGETLTPITTFRNDLDPNYKLEGASRVVSFGEPFTAAIASFYDSSLTLFTLNPSKQNPDNFSWVNAHSDNLSYERIFKSNEDLGDLDALGLLGAWDVIVTPDEKQVFVASYQSNAVTVFNAVANASLAFDSKLSFWEGSDASLGRPVSLAYAKRYNELVVAGFEGNVLSIFKKEQDGSFVFKNAIRQDDDKQKLLANPQHILFSPNEQFLYVACSGSQSIVVFERVDDEFVYKQAITNADIGGVGLNGVSSLVTTGDGKLLFAAGEFDEGLLVFNVSDIGEVAFAQHFKGAANDIKGITSIAITNDDKHLLLSLGKQDALYMIQVTD
ncbi:MAG: beta-propeller fold lactonase family protein [Alteromonadaceae bacterium]|nr:beta-propeller fold lactonase family protein [Alteromonadaceae bacterium]